MTALVNREARLNVRPMGITPAKTWRFSSEPMAAAQDDPIRPFRLLLAFQ